jgi:hypothetical protein
MSEGRELCCGGRYRQTLGGGGVFAGSSNRWWMLMTGVVIRVSVLSEGEGDWQVEYRGVGFVFRVFLIVIIRCTETF